MRFIGNKTNLLEKIKEVIDENCNDGSQIFCDIFCGLFQIEAHVGDLLIAGQTEIAKGCGRKGLGLRFHDNHHFLLYRVQKPKSRDHRPATLSLTSIFAHGIMTSGFENPMKR